MLETRSIAGLPVSRMGLGLAALGRPGYINLGHAQDLQQNYDPSVMEAHAFTVLDAAWASGIRYFDTARSYGRGELFLGNWLRSRNIPPAEVSVGSKWGYTYTADWQVQAAHHEIKDHSLPVLDRQWQESQATLGEYLDLYQIHSATLKSGVLGNSPVLTRLAELKAAGTRIGLSLSGANQAEVLQKALGIQLDGIRLFDSVQATYNLLEPSAGPMLQAAQAAGMGIIVKEALANGRLTARNQEAGVIAPLQTLAASMDSTVDALALAFVLAHPWVDVVLSGAAQVNHLQSNLSAFAMAWDPALSTQLAVLAESPTKYWQTRKGLDWN